MALKPGQALWLTLLPLLLGALTTIAVAWVLAVRVSLWAGPEWIAEDQSFRSGTWSLERFEPPPVLSGSIPAPYRYAPVVRLVYQWRSGNNLTQGDHVSFDTLAYLDLSAVRSNQRAWETHLASTSPRPAT